jgi:MFS family permease
VIYASLGVNFLFLPVFLQFLDLSPTVSGLAFIPPSLALILLAPRFGRVADTIGPRLPVAAGAAAIGFSALFLLPISKDESVWSWGIASILLFSLGLAAIVAPITSAALTPAPGDLAGIASGLNQTVARVGGVLSVAVAGALAGWVYARAGGLASTPFDPDTSESVRGPGVEAFRAVVLLTAGLALAGAGLAVALLPGRRPSPEVAGEVAVSPCPQVGPSA